jgi:hypothetical protein
MSDPVEQMMIVQSRGLELFKRKNKDYGNAYKEFGLIGVLVRLEDKIKRCLSISNSGVTLVDDERLEDTLLDLHNYAAMALTLMAEKPTENKKELDINTGPFNAGL